MRVIAQKRMILRVSGMALIGYSGLLFLINNYRRPASNTVTAVSIQNSSPGPAITPSPVQNTRNLIPVSKFVMGSKGDVQVANSIPPHGVGDLFIENRTDQAVPVLSFGIFTKFEVNHPDPTTPYREMMTSDGYAEWFKNNRQFVLRGFTSQINCKTPVILGEAPAQPHTLVITITAGDAKKCLGQ